MKICLKQSYTADELSIVDGFNNTSANKFILLRTTVLWMISRKQY